MFICDAHCDTLYRLLKEPGSNNDVTPERLKCGGVGLQTLAMFVGTSSDKKTIINTIEGMMAISDELRQEGLDIVDDPDLATEGEVKYMLSIEGSEVFEDDLSLLEAYRKKGVRMASLTWNYDNKFASCHMGDTSRGLSNLGKECVREMNRLGIAVDLSHISEKAFKDVLDHALSSPLASHSCAKALCNHSRNLSDEQLVALFNAGGFVGINFCPAFLNEKGEASMLDVLKHIEHMYELGGSGKVGFGSDFDGIDTKPIGLDNPENFPALIRFLADSGSFSDDDIADISGRAFINYYKKL
jgi:membrane dipeptidase